MTRVLIVDDHEIVRRGLREILNSRLGNVIVGEAEDAGAAINLLIQETWDVVLLDINMPGRSGIEVLEEARRIRPGTPVLLLTSYPEEQFAVRAFKLGAAGYVTKQEASDPVDYGRAAGAGGRQIRHPHAG
jgi:two-component system invasion response regulator UvrY